MSETMRTLALEILKSKYDIKSLDNVEIHKTYREIYSELQKAEKDYVNTNPRSKFLR